jgi:hypothetical protein
LIFLNFGGKDTFQMHHRVKVEFTSSMSSTTSVLASVKGNHVLVYDIEKGKFKFHSNSMREATRRFIETNK